MNFPLSPIRDCFLTLAVAALALAATPARSQVISGGDFQLFKPGSTTVTAELVGGTAYVPWTGVIPPANLNVTSGGSANYSDGTTGTTVDLPGWAKIQGGADFMYNGPGGSVALNCYAAWGGDTRVETTGSLHTITAGETITISVDVSGGPGGPMAGPLAFHLYANGTLVTPSSSVNISGEASKTISRTYDPAALAGHIGASTKIVLGVEDANNQGGRIIFDNVTLGTSVPDTTPPTLAAIVDDKGGGRVAVNTLVNYTVTFSEDMDASTVDATDFGNADSSTITIGTVTEITPGVFTVQVTPTSGGTLQLEVNAGAVLNDAAGNSLVTTSAIADDTILAVILPAVIATHPASVTINSGSTATLTVVASGTEPFFYRWYQGVSGDFSTPVGTDSASFTTPVLTATTSYWVNVINGADPLGVDSNTATVTVSPPATVFTWITATSGNWSDASKWTNDQSSGTAPIAAGQADYTLNFNAAGTYTATNDLNAGFLLNQLNFGGSAVTLAGNGLTFVTNGAALPQLNQNSASAVTVSAPLSLAADLTSGGTGGATVSLSGVISGTGGLIKTSPGTLNLVGANTYSGGTTVQGGTLVVTGAGTLGAATGVLTVDGASARVVISLPPTPRTVGTVNLLNGGQITGPSTLSAAAFNVESGTISARLAGTGGLTKTTTATVTLSAANTYTGDTTVNAGTLALSTAPDPLNANPGNDASKVTIAATGAALNLTYTGTDKVDKLFIGTTQMAAGVYGAGNLSQITGSGTLTITSGLTPGGYASWQAANGTTGGFGEDHDNDGTLNGIEYFLGGTFNTTGLTPLPGVTNTAGTYSVTWTKAANGYPGAYGTDFWVETSATSTGPWMPEGSNVVISGPDVTYTFPAPGTNFVRLFINGPDPGPGGGVAYTPPLTVGQPTQIATHPASTTINSGGTATLAVVASGTEPITYQWFEGITGITTTPVGTNSASFTTPALSTTTNYWVKVTNAANSIGANSNTATVTVSAASPPNTFSVNFYVGPDFPYGGLTTDEQKANVRVAPGVPAGLGDWYTSGWLNFLVPWSPTAPLAPVTLTSNQGSTATFTFKDCRNGWTYSGPRTTLLGDGNGNMMDAHLNSTLDPGDGSNLFDMEVTGIPFAVYDVIFYVGANAAQFGDGTGVIKFNGGAERAFTLKPGAFDGTFTEMIDATTQGNYIVFRGVTGTSFTTQTWGTGPGGFNHIGPNGFQIKEATVTGADYDSWTAANAGGQAPDLDFDSDGRTNKFEYAFGLNATLDTSVNPITVPFDRSAGTFSYTRRAQALSGLTFTVETSPDLIGWTAQPLAALMVTLFGDVETVMVTLPASALPLLKGVRVVVSGTELFTPPYPFAIFTQTAAIASTTFNLGAAGSGTLIPDGGSIAWLAPGALPPGSLLQSVSIHARLDHTLVETWASNLNVVVGGALQIGSDGGGPDWANGQNFVIGTTVIDTKTAGIDFPATIDLNTTGLALMNTWGDATWSGTVTVTYDAPIAADILTFGLPGNPAVITGTNIALTVPYGTDVTVLAPDYTLSPGATCDHDSGTEYDFTAPVVYTVLAEDLTTKAYTVTVTVAAAVPAAIATHPASTTINSGGTTTLTVTASGTEPFTYQWYQGASGTTTTPVGTNSNSFTTPVLTVTTSYWVKVSNDANPTGADSNTATITIASPASDFTYTSNGSAITIIGYTGAGGVVWIPAMIDGLPVTAVAEKAFVNNPSLTSVTIPSSVTTIGYEAFGNCSSLTALPVDALNPAYSSVDGVLFNKSQTTLVAYPAGLAGSYAVPASVIRIGEGAFYACNGLTSVTIPDGVTEIGVYAFAGCSSLTAITANAENSTYSSVDGVLLNKSQTLIILCPGGKAGSYTVPSSVTSIGDLAFFLCSSLTSVVIPDSVTSIGNAAFHNCPSLISVSVPNSVTSIGSQAFQMCTSLTSVVIPSSVTSIGDSAFHFCHGLTSTRFLGNAPSIGTQVFDSTAAGFTVYYLTGTTGFTSPTWQGYPAVALSSDPGIITHPAAATVTTGSTATLTVAAIGTEPFTYQWYQGTTGDTSTPVGTDSASFTTPALTATTSYWVKVTNAANPTGANSNTATLTIASPASDFTYTSNGSAITITGYTGAGGAVSIPGVINGLPVTAIGQQAFFGKYTITSVVIPSSVIAIESGAFSSIYGLTNVSIPASVTRIGDRAFSICYGLTSVSIPASVTSIGVGPFEGCRNLPSIVVDVANTSYSSLDGVLFNQAQTILHEYPGGKTGIYAIPVGVTSILDSAFSSCLGLTSVSIPSGAISIGSYSFASCSNLTNVMIGNTVASIGRWAFHSCSALTSVTIPDSVISIGDQAFQGCRSLNSLAIGTGVATIGRHAFGSTNLFMVTIPASVTSIGQAAFGSCTSLTSITVDVGNPAYSSLDGVLFNKNRTALVQCPGGRTDRYTIPAGVTRIETLAFYGCTSLSEITLPASVTVLSAEAFESCVSLARIIIPSSVTSIGNYAFSGCRGLALAYFLGNAPAIGTSAFSSVASGFKVYYLSGSAGFTTPTWNGYPAIGVAGNPAVITHPASATITSGSTATLAVAAFSTEPLTYQWYQGASGTTTTPVGTNSATFTTPALSTTTSYWVKVTNAANPTGANSNTVTVTVNYPIPVENFSFELPDLRGDAAPSEQWSVDAPPGWTAVAQIPGPSDTAVGVTDSTNSMYSNSNGPVLPGTAHGAQLGYMNLDYGNLDFSNTFTYSGFSLGTFVQGATYKLTVALGGRRQGALPSTFRIDLLANGARVGSGTSATVVMDTFFDVTYTFTATAAEAGKPIGIQIFAAKAASSIFAQANFDNVRLTTSAPGSNAKILAFGLPGNPAVINGSNISLAVPYGSNVTSLAPTFILAAGARCDTPSGTVQNFTTPQAYTVTSADGLVTTVYTVTVVVGPTWTDDASGLWSTASNWSGGIVANGSGGTADFNSANLTADRTVSLDSPRTIGNLIFGDTATASAAGWTVNNNGSTANILTLAGESPTITVNALGTGKDATLSAELAGTAGLTKTGPGTLTLTHANSYAGNTVIDEGVLRLGGTNGSVGVGNVINNGTLAFNHSGAFTLSNIVFGTGGLRQEGPGTVLLAGEKFFTGATEVTGGALAIANDLHLGTAPSLPTAGKIVLSGGGKLTVSDSGTTLHVNRGMTLNGGGGILEATGTNNLIYRGRVTGTGGLTLSMLGTGEGQFGNVGSAYSGVTTIAASSKLVIFNDSTGSATTGNLTAGDFGTGTLVMNTTSIRPTTAGTRTVGNAITLQGNLTMQTTPSGTSTSLTFNGPVTLTGATRSIANNANTATALLTFSGAIGDGGSNRGLTFNSTTGRIVVLSGSNTYTGRTTVASGTLRVGSSGLPSGSDVTLAGGILDLAGASPTAKSLTVTGANAMIDFGSVSSPNTLSFINGATAGWTGNVSLRNFNPATDTVYCGSSAAGIANNISRIKLVNPVGYPAGSYSLMAGADGKLSLAEQTAGDFRYTSYGPSAIITGYSGPGGELTIPNQLNGLPVTAIGASAFANNPSLTGVTIPATVTNIGDAAFAGCTNLVSALFLGSAPTMGTGVFASTAAGFSVYFFDGRAGFSSPTWQGYPAVNLGSPAPAVTTNTASGITGTSATLTGTVNPHGFATTARFEYGLTDSYGSIATVTLSPADGSTIQTVAADLTGLQPGQIYHYRITASNSEGPSVGADMTLMTAVPFTYANTGGTITLTEFTGTGDEVHIPVMIYGLPVTRVGGFAFHNLGNVTRVTLPASVTVIDDFAFASCRNLAAIILPDGLTRIGDFAFYDCGSLTDLTLPGSVTDIGDYAFALCDNLAHLTLGESLARIGEGAFFFCEKLTQVVIPSSVIQLGESAFEDCSRLTNATFLGNAPARGAWVFEATAASFAVHHFDGAAGFAAPGWQDQPAVNMGTATPLATWLIDQSLPFNANLQDDANGDGVNLLMAYALGLDPQQNLSGSMPQPVIAAAQMSLTFYAGRTDVTYIVQSSTDLATWTDEALSAPDAGQRRTATVPMTAPGCYLRIVARVP